MGSQISITIVYYFEVEYTGTLTSLYQRLYNYKNYNSYCGWIGIGERTNDLLVDFVARDELPPQGRQAEEALTWKKLYVGFGSIVSAGTLRDHHSSFPKDPLEKIMKELKVGYGDLKVYTHYNYY